MAAAQTLSVSAVAISASLAVDNVHPPDPAPVSRFRPVCVCRCSLAESQGPSCFCQIPMLQSSELRLVSVESPRVRVLSRGFPPLTFVRCLRYLQVLGLVYFPLMSYLGRAEPPDNAGADPPSRKKTRRKTTPAS
eukprot:746941-Rhodomonas_salina.1